MPRDSEINIDGLPDRDRMGELAEVEEIEFFSDSRESQTQCF